MHAVGNIWIRLFRFFLNGAALEEFPKATIGTKNSNKNSWLAGAIEIVSLQYCSINSSFQFASRPDSRYLPLRPYMAWASHTLIWIYPIVWVIFRTLFWGPLSFEVRRVASWEGIFSVIACKTIILLPGEIGLSLIFHQWVKTHMHAYWVVIICYLDFKCLPVIGVHLKYDHVRKGEDDESIW